MSNRPDPHHAQVGAARDLAFALKKSLGLTDPLTPQYEREQIATFLHEQAEAVLNPKPLPAAWPVSRPQS